MENARGIRSHGLGSARLHEMRAPRTRDISVIANAGSE